GEAPGRSNARATRGHEEGPSRALAFPTLFHGSFRQPTLAVGAPVDERDASLTEGAQKIEGRFQNTRALSPAPFDFTVPLRSTRWLRPPPSRKKRLRHDLQKT